MNKSIDLKNRIVDMYDVDTEIYESEIISYLDRKMLVRFHSAHFNNKNYVLIGNPKDMSSNSITVKGYRKRVPGEKISVDIGYNN